MAVILYFHGVEGDLTSKQLHLSMVRKYIERIQVTDHFQTYTDSQVYLGMLEHGQAVDTRLFWSSHMAWVQGYLRCYSQ